MGDERRSSTDTLARKSGILIASIDLTVET